MVRAGNIILFMLNHFRTRLLNLSYTGDVTEHIPRGFMAIPVPVALQELQELLFPANTSRSFKLFLVHNYLRMIDATTYRDLIYQFDSRIDYESDYNEEYFKLNRNSAVTISNTAFPLFIYGKYSNDPQSGNMSDTVEIRQQGSTAVVDVLSLDRNTYYAQNISLTFSGSVSQVIPLANTELSVQLGGTSGTFTASSNKRWSFLTEAPLVFAPKFPTQAIGNKMFNYRRNECTATYENLWTQHYNPAFKVAGLLAGYVERMELSCRT